MRNLLFATTAIMALALAPAANAVQIIGFSQSGTGNTVTATTNVGNTVTTINGSSAVSIGNILGGGSTTGFMSFTATSSGIAQTFLGAILQNYGGTFCITSLAGCGGTNLLSGVFTDGAFGGVGGPGLTLNVNNPPDSLTLTSSVISPANLIAPNSFSLALSNLLGGGTPDTGLHILGTTIAPFTASFSGTVSSSATAAPEPMSIALLGAGLVGLGVARRRKRSI